MKIITGSAKGKRLITLEGEATRPTSERIKEAIFSSIQFDVEHRVVLDLFAGCGQMGLEALSRGAVSAMFIDAAAEAMAIIKENAQKTDFFKCSRFLISDYRSYIRKAAGRDVYDLIFIDPPYASDAAVDAVARILEAKLAADGCLVVVESGAPLDTEENSALLSEFFVIKTARYSKSYVTILQKKGEDL